MPNVIELPFEFTFGGATTEEQVWCPFPPFNSGSWIFRYDKSSQRVSFSCQDVYSTVEASAIKLTTFNKESSNYDLSTDGCIGGTEFPPNATWSITCSVSNGSYNYSNQRPRWMAKFQICFPPQAVARGPYVDLKALAKACAGRATTMQASYAPNDVVLYFHRSKRELWAISTILKRASPYFRTLLDSGFKESSASPVGSCVDTDLTAGVDLAQDSDDEADRIPFKAGATRTKSSLPANVKEVVIKATAYTTYHAALTFISSGFVHFAPLSIPSLTAKSAGSSRTSALTDSAQADPDLPLPASPKSIYKLAHLLELDNLAKLALDDYKAKLTVENVLYELVTDMAMYEDARQAMVAYAVANWEEVRKTAVAVELKKAEVIDGLPNASAAVAGLFDLATKAAKLDG